MTRGRALILLWTGLSVALWACVERALPGSPIRRAEDSGAASDGALDAARRRDAGARQLVLESLPANGARDVPPSLRSIAFRMAADVTTLDAFVVTSRGRTTGRLVESRCELSGLEPGGRCGEVPIATPFDRDEVCVLEVRSGDVTETVSFRTADDDDARPPGLAAPAPCMPDEVPLERACARIEDVAVVVRFVPDELSRCLLSTGSGMETGVLYEGGVASLRVGGLVPDRDEIVWWSATDLAGNQARDGPFAFRTAAARARLALTEVSANPQGPEPAQEWIEVLSWAGSEMDVGGFVIVDDSGEEVVLPEGPPLVPGQRALVVPSGFDASDARDVLPAPGTRLIRVEPRSLGSGGLRNGGERLELRDREGRVVSRAPAADLSRGDCLARVGAPDVDDPSAWQRRPCSPGAPP